MSDVANLIARESLKAQQSLAPYAVAALILGVLLFLPSALVAEAPARLLAPAFAVGLALFAFRVVQGRVPGLMQEGAGRIGRVQTLTALIWAASLLSVTGFAVTAGPLAQQLLLLTLGAAVVIAYFAAPHLPSLLVAAPLAAAPPLLGLYAVEGSARDFAPAVVALAWALCLIQNRSHRRTYELTVEREALTAAREAALAEAERLAKTKSALISTLSTQLRTGLTAAEQALSAALAARRRRVGSGDSLESALTSVQALGVTVTSTLDAEDAEAGRLTLRPEPFDLGGLLAAAAEAHRPAAAAKGLELEVCGLERLNGAAVADAERVSQAVAALLSNAVRYTARGRVELSVAQDDALVRVSVADTGPGLSPEELARALEPFERIERTCAGVPGAGLGLTLAARLADLFGERLELDSVVGVGSRFSFRLPYDPAARPVSERPVAAQRLLTGGGDALSAAQLRDAAEALGCQVVHAVRPERAPALARRAEFDVVILDEAPEALWALLRAEPALREAAFLALAPADAVSSPAGADACVRKPVDAAALARGLAEAAQNRREALRPAA